jgi:phenol hydroxylase P0 protein
MGSVTSSKTILGNSKHFVRVTDWNVRGNVEFQYSINDPTLFLEMILPRSAFNDFCATRGVRLLTSEQEAEVDANDRRWRFGDDEE